MACSKKCFTFIWKLENVSYSSEGKGNGVYSPDFVVDSIDETLWYLGLFLSGDEDENYIGFFLYRGQDCKGPETKEIKFQLDFIDKKGSVILAREALKQNFLRDSSRGFSEFVKREEVFDTKRSEFLPQDTLTARCRIWKTDGEMPQDIQCVARTCIGVQKMSFLWKVKNFTTLESDKKYLYKIKSVVDYEQLMSINLYLTDELNADKTIRFEITNQDVYMNFSTLQLSLVDASGNKVNCNQESFRFRSSNETDELKLCFTKNKLMEMKSSYLPDDVLSLLWEWTFSQDVLFEKIEDFQYACASVGKLISGTRNVNKRKLIPVSDSLNDKLKSLYDENFLCDVKLKTSTCTFDTHKIILCASSSVFKTMFSSNMKENYSNLVNIEDLNDETVSLMLFFMYSARVEDLTWEKALHLYAAADKYAILSLKYLCSSYMMDNLSLSNACEVLVLSEFHADGDLKSIAQDYILKNIRSIVNSDEWKLLMDTNSKLAAETLCLHFK